MRCDRCRNDVRETHPATLPVNVAFRDEIVQYDMMRIELCRICIRSLHSWYLTPRIEGELNSGVDG